MTPSESPHRLLTRNALTAVLVISVILVASGAFYFIAIRGFGTGPNSTTFESTVTFTSASPCSNVVQTQSVTTSSINASQFPDFAPLFGNFSEMTIVEYAYTSIINSIITSRFRVLARNSTASGQTYKVNVTTIAAESFNESAGSTPVNNQGNQTNRQSAVLFVASNGSAIPTSTGLGNENEAEIQLAQNMILFQPLISLDQNPLKQVSVINTTTAKIGSAIFQVTNYRHSSMVYIQTADNCGGSTSNSTSTISNWTIQAANVLGTNNFTLITQMSQQYSDSFSRVVLTVVLKVISFEI